MIKLIWKFDEKYQINKYLQTARMIKGKYYVGKIFITPKRHTGTYFFPDYKLFERKDLVEKLPDISEDFKSPHVELVKYLKSQDFQTIKRHEVEGIKKSFQVKFNKYIKDINFIFPNLKLKQITIIPTSFGMGSSFHTQKNEIVIYYSIYRDPDIIFRGITQGIIAMLLELAPDKEHDIFRQKVGDFMNNHTILNKYNLIHQDILLFNKKMPGEVVLESRNYYFQMGIPGSDSFEIKNNLPFFKNHPVKNLQNQEIKLLNLFISKKNEILDYEKIAGCLWENEWRERYSLYAISKAVDRLKTKLEKLGSNEFIFTVRKKGYVLND